MDGRIIHLAGICLVAMLLSGAEGLAQEKIKLDPKPGNIPGSVIAGEAGFNLLQVDDWDMDVCGKELATAGQRKATVQKTELFEIRKAIEQAKSEAAGSRKEFKSAQSEMNDLISKIQKKDADIERRMAEHPEMKPLLKKQQDAGSVGQALVLLDSKIRDRMMLLDAVAKGKIKESDIPKVGVPGGAGDKDVGGWNLERCEKELEALKDRTRDVQAKDMAGIQSEVEKKKGELRQSKDFQSLVAEVDSLREIWQEKQAQIDKQLKDLPVIKDLEKKQNDYDIGYGYL